MNKAFLNHMESMGIEYRNNIPYQHQMNGIVERMNRTVMTKARKNKMVV